MSRKLNRRIASPSSTAFVPNPQSAPFPSIGEFEISSLASLTIIPSFPKLVVMVCCLVVIICMMASIRDSTNEENKEYDARPSVKFFKSRYLSTAEPLAVAAALSIVPVLSFIEPMDPFTIENAIKTAIANYRPNLKAPKTPTGRNGSVWVNGSISRILGLLNSCPSSRAGLSRFGLKPGAASSLSVHKILAAIPLPENCKPSPLRVVVELRIVFGIIDREMKLVSQAPIVFDERPLDSFSAPAKAAGISNLEYEVFVMQIPRNDSFISGIPVTRAVSPNTAIKSLEENKPVVRPFEKADLESFLSPLEQAIYDSAIRLGNKLKLKELNLLVLDRKKEGTKYTSQSANNSSSSLLDGFDFAVRSKEESSA